MTHAALFSQSKPVVMYGCRAINWLPVDHDDLLRGIGHVQYEWTQMAGCAARLELVDGIRTPDENATLEALLVHARCLINFLCGNYKGGWMPEDMSRQTSSECRGSCRMTRWTDACGEGSR